VIVTALGHTHSIGSWQDLGVTLGIARFTEDECSSKVRRPKHKENGLTGSSKVVSPGTFKRI
jgi:hypothetical protein